MAWPRSRGTAEAAASLIFMVRAKLGQHDALFGLCGPVASRLSLASLAVAAVAAGAATAVVADAADAAHHGTQHHSPLCWRGSFVLGVAALWRLSSSLYAAELKLGRFTAPLSHGARPPFFFRCYLSDKWLVRQVIDY